MSQLISLTLLTKPGCHLCEEAREVIDAVVSEFLSKNLGNVHIELTEENILLDKALTTKYGEEIPVLQINGDTHAYWRIDPERLHRVLAELLTK